MNLIDENHLFRLWQDALEVTGTFKQMKVKLAEEGFNPAVIKDPLFYLEDNKGYVPMAQEIFNSIAEGRIRLWMTLLFIFESSASNCTFDFKVLVDTECWIMINWVLMSSTFHGLLYILWRMLRVEKLRDIILFEMLFFWWRFVLLKMPIHAVMQI